MYATIAESVGIVDKLEELQMHPNQKVYDKAVEVLEKYFATDDQLDIMNIGIGNDQANTQISAENLWGTPAAPEIGRAHV